MASWLLVKCLPLTRRSASMGRVRAAITHSKPAWQSFPPHPRFLAFTSSGTSMYLIAAIGRRLVRWDVANRRLAAVSEFAIKEEISVGAVSHGGSVCATDGSPGEILLWDPTTLSLLGTMPVERNKIFALEFTRDGRSLILARYGQSFDVWNIASRKRTMALTSSFPRLPLVGSIAIAPDDSRVAAILLDDSPKDRQHYLWHTSRILRGDAPITPSVTSTGK